jgi:membrane fusion protein (multidrug efflux system)
MLQRMKSREASHLSMVPASAETGEEQATNESQPAAEAAPVTPAPTPTQDRGADTPPPSAKAGAKARLAAGLKANRKRILQGLAAVALIGAAWFGYDYLTVGRYMVSTDDAYVRADATTLAAKVSGYVAAIDARDNTFVHAGDVVARIEDGDYRLALDLARDKVATQQATVERIGRQVVAQQASVGQARAELASAQAAQTRAAAELARQQALATREFASRQTLEQAQATRDQSVAAVQKAQAALDGATATVDVLKAQQQEAARTLAELQTAQAKAERDLSFTEIRAPVDGVLGNRAMQVGDFVQTGQRLAALVPLTDVYVDANFKETQLNGLRPGQQARVSVDALPEHDITGEVASVSPASGAVFSLLPPDNATGNFTKIVQRLAVRIRLPAAVTEQRLLRPGMSVVVSVNTKPTALASNPLSFAAQAAESPGARSGAKSR